MAIRKLSHLGIAVEALAAQVPFYRDVLGLTWLGEEEVADQGVRVALFQLGEARLELLEPTRPDSPIARFLAQRGPGLHHVAYEVEDVGGMLQRLRQQGCRLIDEQPRAGAHGALIAFLHPRATHGVLTELCQEAPAAPDADRAADPEASAGDHAPAGPAPLVSPGVCGKTPGGER